MNIFPIYEIPIIVWIMISLILFMSFLFFVISIISDDWAYNYGKYRKKKKMKKFYNYYRQNQYAKAFKCIQKKYDYTFREICDKYKIPYKEMLQRVTQYQYMTKKKNEDSFKTDGIQYLVYAYSKKVLLKEGADLKDKHKEKLREIIAQYAILEISKEEFVTSVDDYLLKTIRKNQKQ